MQKTHMYIAVAVAVVVVGLFVFLGFFGVNTPAASTDTTNVPASEAQALLDEISRTGSVSELKIVDTVVGTGELVKSGDTVIVNYTGVLPNGQVFDSSRQEGRSPFEFVLGTGNVIQGWHQGIAGMKVGGRRILAIPASLGYGDSGNGPIPPGATLIFDVELLGIKAK